MATVPNNVPLFQRDFSYGFPLLCIHKVRINLGGGHVAVREHLRYGIDVSAGSNLQGGIGVPETVERERLVDSGIKEPLFERVLGHGFGEAFEYLSLPSVAAKVQGFIADGEGGIGSSLDGPDAHAVAAVRNPAL